MDELAQQQLQAASSRVAEANVSLSAAHTAATRAVDAGALDFRERIKTLIEDVDALFADMEEAAGPITPHRGLRAPVTCQDDDCPVHGKNPGRFLEAGSEFFMECSTASKLRGKEGAAPRTLHGRAGYE